ncbi:unnamed protein product [Rodentolepis nana]|uniref:Uncharacterized protein n=1 Tax=Rodentolepis nana TaxID=102285 RepID=A0A0R3TM09_RODNA|nr:unnamed protein product [Rodentolepis nana]
MCSIVRALVLFVLCLAIVTRASSEPAESADESAAPLSDAPGQESEVSAGSTEALETSSPMPLAEDTTTSTSASSLIVASTLAVPLLPALMLGY